MTSGELWVKLLPVRRVAPMARNRRRRGAKEGHVSLPQLDAGVNASHHDAANAIAARGEGTQLKWPEHIERRRSRHRSVAYAMLMLLSLAWTVAPAAQAGALPAMRDDTGYRLDVKGVRGQALPENVTKAQVHKIVDGDTIEIVYPPDDWWYKVRIIGINAPESVKPDTPVQCYGKEASRRLAAIIPVGATIYLERDVSDEDQYGRLLRHVWVVDAGTGQAYLVSELLARGGYVDVRRYPPDDKYDDRLAMAELAARHEDDGLWGACPRITDSVDRGSVLRYSH